MARFPFFRQLDAMDCGPACLRMICKYHGRAFSAQSLRRRARIDRGGVSLLGLGDAAESVGMHSLAVSLPYETLAEAPLPCIAHWNQNHFVVVYRADARKVTVGDPGIGVVTYSRAEFLKGWGSINGREGVCLLVEPTPDFHALDGDEPPDKQNFRFLFSYLSPHRRMLVQLFLGLLIGGAFQLVAPLLTQTLVDVAIKNREIGLVHMILAGQLVLFISRTVIEVIRGWILLHVGTRINISIISDFLVKLMKLPLSFFGSRMTGDILQRINDHQRIETFLSSTTLNTLFSVLNLMILAVVLGYYSLTILGVFMLGSLLSAGWILFFMKRRAVIDNRKFNIYGQTQSRVIQLISGMTEIKLNGAERPKRWEWERLQARLFKANVAGLSVEQIQQNGSQFLNQFKSIAMTFLAAREVIEGRMTLGMMMAVTSLLGQLEGPISQLLGFARAFQEAKLSLERLGEIHGMDDEEIETAGTLGDIPSGKDLVLDGVSFAYEGSRDERVLDDVSLRIPHGKITALVGASGSGKTTVLKLLLKFHEPTAGEIKLGEIPLSRLGHRAWRRKCGVVMQDGYIFSDTIAENIALGEETIDADRLLHAARVANILDFVEALPLGFETKIGADGHGLSQGQKQRILIARAVYKDHDYLFFDEATSSLDANNERVIKENLDEFFRGKTVVVIAHRLSTVKNADRIVVLDRGRIVEQGAHRELAAVGGAYYRLVKNQLELGN